jgi:hypothetical protein
MSKDIIIEKIKKLLRMKRGGTPAEVETALAIAAELARKHGIDLGGVDPDHVADQPINHIDAVTSARIGWEYKYAALVVQQFFNVTCLLRATTKGTGIWDNRVTRHHITFIGADSDTTIALYVYGFLAKHFRRSWNNRTNARLRNRQAFLYGMYYGVCTKLDEARKSQVNEAGIVLIGKAVVRRDEYMKKNFGEIGEKNIVPDDDANASRVAGLLAGRETEIRSGLTGTGKAAMLLE